MRVFKLLIPIASICLLASCSLQKQINRHLPVDTDSTLANAFTGVYLYDEASGKILAEQNAEKQFIPASNIKLLTAYAVMQYLPDSLPGWYRYETADTLYLKPNGDPTFLHPAFSRQVVFDLLKQTKKTVVLVTPPPQFSARGFGWGWNNYGEYYMPERAVMPIYGNVVKFVRSNGGIITQPAYFQSMLSLNDADLKKPVNIRRAEDENRFTAITSVSNYLMRPFSQKEKPTITCTLLADTLTRLGKAPLIVSGSVPNFPFSPLYTQATDTVLQFMLHNSDNFFAEQMLLMVGSQQMGYLNDRPVIKKLLSGDLSFLPDQPAWVDGSGLSRNNHISPRAFVALLSRMKERFPWERLSTVLVRGGIGTLTAYYKGYQDHLFVKTGTLTGHAALSGYMITKKGRRITFSFLVNHHQAPAVQVRKAVEKMLEEIIDNY